MKSIASIQPSAVREKAPREIRHRLFCFPYAGGGDATYRPWVRHIPSWAEICPVDPRGSGRRVREGYAPDFFDYVVTSAEAVESKADLPFSFFGHSLGALVAFELARYLKRESGGEPRHLFVSGCRGPRVPDRNRSIRDLPDPELMEEVARRYGGIPEDVLAEPDLWGIMLPNLRVDLAAAETYRFVPGTTLTCAITALGGEGTPPFWRRSFWRGDGTQEGRSPIGSFPVGTSSFTRRGTRWPAS